MASGWPAVSRHTWSRSASPSSRMAGSEVVSSAAPERVSGPRRRKASLAWPGVSRVNGRRQVISSLPVQPVSRAARSGSRIVHRPAWCDRLSSKLSQTMKSASAGPAAKLAADTSPLMTLITRPDWSRLTRAAICAASVDLPIPPMPYTTSPPLPGPVRSADHRRRSADRIDSEARGRGRRSELLAWRAACRTRTGRPGGGGCAPGCCAPGCCAPGCCAPGCCALGWRAAGMSCGRTARLTALSCRTGINLATSTPLPRTPAYGASCHCLFI